MIDWTTTDGCARCDEHGPFLPPGVLYQPEAARDAHQAWHAITVELLRPIVRLVEWLSTKLER